MEYRIIRTHTKPGWPKRFEEKVNAAIAEGWKLHGGVAGVEAFGGGYEDETRGFIAQAMVKE